MERIQCASNTDIGNHDILLAETLTTQEAIVNAIQNQTEQIVIESDSLITIKAIMERLIPRFLLEIL